MKERDKIQIQCLKGKNPYIQTAHLLDGKMIYLVKTVDDDHHLYGTPPKSRISFLTGCSGISIRHRNFTHIVAAMAKHVFLPETYLNLSV